MNIKMLLRYNSRRHEVLLKVPSTNSTLIIDQASDVDPVGSGFIWVRGSGSRGIKSLIK